MDLEGSVHSQRSVSLSIVAGPVTLSNAATEHHDMDDAVKRNLGQQDAMDAVTQDAVVCIEVEQPSAPNTSQDHLCSPRRWIVSYLSKLRGAKEQRMPVPGVLELFVAWLGAFLAIFAIAGINQALSPSIDTTLLIPSLGATAVLVFGVPESKLAQPRNVVGGQFLSALVGVTVRTFMPTSVIWVSAPLGMSLALLVMQLTATTHPPGGATALIAASALDPAPGAGYMFLVAIMISTLVMQAIALAVNNTLTTHTYPRYWWGDRGVWSGMGLCGKARRQGRV